MPYGYDLCMSAQTADNAQAHAIRVALTIARGGAGDDRPWGFEYAEGKLTPDLATDLIIQQAGDYEVLGADDEVSRQVHLGDSQPS